MILSFLLIEIKYKKITLHEKNELDKLEEMCYSIIESSINHINNSCGFLNRTLSPNVANIQMHLNVFEERDKNDAVLPSRGFMNYNLCLNAETEQPHTECDSSYTIICVPNQNLNNHIPGNKNPACFQLFVNPESTISIPMTIGTIFTYSGYLLTHRQQILNKDLNQKPFVNIVSYNSKRLFENMMESFRRYLGKV